MTTSDHANSVILLVDDKPDNLDILIHQLEDIGHGLCVALSGEEALKLATEQLPSMILLDIMMPGINGFQTCVELKKNPVTRDIPVIFMSALSGTDSKIKGFSVGGVDFITKPFQREEVIARINTHLTIRRQRLLLQAQNIALEDVNNQLQEQISQTQRAQTALSIADNKLSALTQQEAKQWGIDAFIGNSPVVTSTLEEIRSLQQVDKTNVLVLGESGTGKELISRAIHFGSNRKKNAFIAVNCAAIPNELADSEFFGHAKGAFTGAVSNRPGYFVQADGGTLFLDEIGDMPLQLQAKLLRVLEDGRVTAVGGSSDKIVDVRVVAATNIDLRSKVEQKTFRQDLYYRLSGYVVNLPPLRKRIEDVIPLTTHFLTLLAEQMGRMTSEISSEAIEVLQRYHFPGNVRELKNLIEHALIASRGQTIKPEHFHFIHHIALEGGSFPQPPQNTQPAADAAPPTRAKQQDEQQILDFAKEHGRIDNSAAQKMLNIEHGRASYLLKKLHGEGKLNREGQRRWAYYTLVD